MATDHVNGKCPWFMNPWLWSDLNIILCRPARFAGIRFLWHLKSSRKKKKAQSKLDRYLCAFPNKLYSTMSIKATTVSPHVTRNEIQSRIQYAFAAGNMIDLFESSSKIILLERKNYIVIINFNNENWQREGIHLRSTKPLSLDPNKWIIIKLYLSIDLSPRTNDPLD